MNEKEITDKWKEYCPVYEAWGCYVLLNIVKGKATRQSRCDGRV